MKKLTILSVLFSVVLSAQTVPTLSDEMAAKLSKMPLHCINTEYPNKTGHIINNEKDAVMTLKQLHPSFYGCLDWHSSVHGHWMLVRLLKTKPHLENAQEIEAVLENSFQAEKLKEEALYFSKYQLAGTFERTYGWAWLLKLNEELITWNDARAKRWHENLKPLTREIINKWKLYLPKQTYPNRTGVHPNTAFAMAFALDWARAANDKDFENQIIEKSKYFYLKDKKAPAYMEPDGSDFFSPSLNISYLMSRILSQKEFAIWLNNFYDKRSLNNIKQIPVVSDLSDYQTVHLVGLSFNRAWDMKGIARALPKNHKLKKDFEHTADKFISNALPLLFQGNYGGDHWLASFAVYSMKD